MKNVFYKTVIASLIVVQSGALTALAEPATSVTPEAQLLGQIYVIAGQEKSSQAQKEIQEAYVAYDRTAPVDGREDRMAQAVEDLNVMTKTQTDQILGASRVAIDQLSPADASKPEVLEKTSEGILDQVIGHGSRGAQFACGDRALIGSFVVIGSAGLLALANIEKSGALNSLSIVTLLTGLTLIVTASEGC